MTFFIVLFIVLMQFLWKYIDDLVGKGLSFDVILELFFYAAVTLVPMALPLAILLASLMTFGNLGEKFELTAMKASGISLIQVMAPLIILVSGISVGAFFFQDYALPKAQVKMYTLLFSMRQKSPEVEIPEGVFYDQIPGFNLFVQHKNQETGMLYDVMIYDVSKGGDNATILLSDSAQLAFTNDMRYLYLHLYKGEQFENLRDQTSLDRNVPFRRESFFDKQVLIPFDANFNRLDEGGMRSQYVGKNIVELRHSIDSIGNRVDSIGGIYGAQLQRTVITGRNTYMYEPEIMDNTGVESGLAGSGSKKQMIALSASKPVEFDSIFSSLSASKQADIYTRARQLVKSRSNETEYQSLLIGDEKRLMRRHEIELLKKFTLSVACLVFFFIGAPLGAIIRKGGLGTPLVISILLFLFYYIIDNTGYKMARDGHIQVWVGIWISTFVLAPLGVYVTYKAMNDSSVFDKDVYINRLNKLLGRKTGRSVAPKEVIMNEISYPEAMGKLIVLRSMASGFCRRYGKRLSYDAYWMKGIDKKLVNDISTLTDETVEYLLDCRNQFVVNKLADFPVIRTLWIYHPSGNKIIDRTLEILFPIGLPIYFLAWGYGKSLRSEMKDVVKTCDTIIGLLQSDRKTE